MRKMFLRSLSVLSLLMCLASCSGASSGGGASGMIKASLLSISELGSNFDANYLPDTSSIKQRSGKIDVCLDFDGNQYGWQKVATEYQRLHSGQVKVNINTNYSGTTYGEKLNTELNNTNTDWDICEGNLGYGSTKRACLNVSTFGNMTNSYCGKNVVWGTVLDDTAFSNVESGASEVYLINSETMQSCWFINTVALKAAGEEGYLNANGEVGNPVTWDDLISLCSYMEKAGYSHPLGISLADASVKSLQFTWLLRIYGDYYYRQFYPYVMSSGDYWDKYDATAKNVEKFTGFGFSYNKVANLMLDETASEGPGYIGFKSEIYKDFVSQLAKMKGHLIANTDVTEFNALRDQFRMQSLGKNSAQIMLDYVGNGVLYTASQTTDYQIDFFDYPQMMSGYYQDGEHEGERIVSTDTITRDIGGNGGFLSIIKHIGNSEQDQLNLDFIKFFLSPYGQTLYYQGMDENNVAPKGLTTVNNNLINIPEKWQTFFSNTDDKISFNGNVDGNTFIAWGVRYFNGYLNTENSIVQNWRNLLMTNVGSGTLNVNSFASLWAEACYQDYLLMCADQQWPTDTYKNFYGNL